MATYLELKSQAKALLQQVEEARQAELVAIIDEIRTRIADYGLTPEQIFGRKHDARGGIRSRASSVPPKYFNPKTGATWSGRGREPLWIKGKERERFLIER
jgi:DNA-binding protein H-NS